MITPDDFVVDTNEDGFKGANIEAICATGESLKKASASDDHIGEKGFGFKSVFSIAEDVLVQSMIWSFRFKHRTGQDGIGMVTPLNADPGFVPADTTTRITLRLSSQARTEYHTLLDAVADMSETTIFFIAEITKDSHHCLRH